MDSNQTKGLYCEISKNAKQTVALLEEILRQKVDVEFSCEVLDTYDLYTQFAKTADYGLKTLGEKPAAMRKKDILATKWKIRKNAIFSPDEKKISLCVMDTFEKNEEALGDYRRTFVNAGKQAMNLCQAFLDTQQDERRTYIRYLN